MNAEFTEKKIVITTETVEGETVKTITPAKVRKGLDTKAFVGAMICSSTGNSYLVLGAHMRDDGKIGMLDMLKDIILYDPATGDLTIAPANNGSGQTTEPGTT